MARCTNCSEELPFSKVAFLSKLKNTVECQQCHTVLEGDQKQLGVIGGISGGVGGLLGFLTVYFFFSEMGLAVLFLLLAGAVILTGAIVQNRTIKLQPRCEK